MAAFLVTGRSLKNYHAKGAPLEPGSVRAQCLVCAEQVTISPSGAAKLVEARANGHHPAGAICTPCVLAVTGPGAVIETSEFGAKLVHDSDNAKAIMAALIDRTKR